MEGSILTNKILKSRMCWCNQGCTMCWLVNVHWFTLMQCLLWD